ncbi:MAG: hypothetical protein QNJ02_16790 [Desulfobacterales bacterium]|nr:hypothetical protein [Desulfobacterales bacterium]
MGRFFHRLAIYYAAGSAGALVSSLALWLCGTNGITAFLQVSIHPRLSPEWLYPRLVWGGIWGLMLFLPLVKSRLLMRSLLISLGPTAAQLFYVYPVLQHRGLLGLKLGLLTPVVIAGIHWIWGMAALACLRLMDKN